MLVVSRARSIRCLSCFRPKELDNELGVWIAIAILRRILRPHDQITDMNWQPPANQAEIGKQLAAQIIFAARMT